MVWNCNKITNEVIFLIRPLIYGFINAERFLYLKFLKFPMHQNLAPKEKLDVDISAVPSMITP